MHSNSSDIALEVHDLSVSYDRKPVLWGIDFEIPKGVLCGVIGPNGAGKSTLLKAIMEVGGHTSGYSKILGQPLDVVRNKVGYVPQRESVDWEFPISVREVVAMGRYGSLGLFGRMRKADQDAVDQALEDVNLTDLQGRQISQLSGGQQQRVFMARSLAQDAEVYFMDEPFAGVDAATEETIMSVLLRMKERGKTVFVVHHDLQTVQKYFDWIILLNMSLIAAGPMESAFTTENLTKTYGGKLTLLSELSAIMQKEGVPTREKNL
jgi:manganese/zinc/iron transport system ATP- binding protein